LVSESGGSVSIGSTAFSALTTGFNDYSVLYLYLTDNSDCWNFFWPVTKDYRESLVISDTSPDEVGGHMASSGDGTHARHVGWVILNITRQMDGDYSIAGAFNDSTLIEFCEESDSGWNSLTLDTETTFGCGTRHILVPEDWTVRVRGDVRVRNQSTSSCTFSFRIRFDSDEKELCEVSVYRDTTNSWPEIWNEHLFYSEKVTSDVSTEIKFTCYPTGTGSSPEYNDSDGTWMEITRIPPSQSLGFTRRQPAGVVTPDYSPPDFIWKDTGTLTIPRGRYYMAGHRVGRQYQNHNDMGIYRDVTSNIDLDVDGSSLVGGDVASSWYSVFMKDDGSLLVLPYIRVSAISYSSPDTTINPADHDDGTTANDGFVNVDDCFNGYRLVYISLDSNNGETWTISDCINGTPDQIKVSEDITSIVSVGNWLQMIPRVSDIYVYLGTIRFDSSGDLRKFIKMGWKYGDNEKVTISGNLSTAAANTELGPAVPPVARELRGAVFVCGTDASVTQVRMTTYEGDSGTTNTGSIYLRCGRDGSDIQVTTKFTHRLSSITSIRNNFDMYTGSWVAATSGDFQITGWEE
jgi:hypothetical protein